MKNILIQDILKLKEKTITGSFLDKKYSKWLNQLESGTSDLSDDFINFLHSKASFTKDEEYGNYINNLIKSKKNIKISFNLYDL